MALNAEWIVPIGLGILGIILFFMFLGPQAVPVKIKKPEPRRL